jgi:hypothetical protein
MKDTLGKLALAAMLMATTVTAHAADCAGGVDVTGNECNGGTPLAASSQRDGKRIEAEQAATKLDMMRANVKQREMKVAIARSTLIGAESELERARESLDAEQRAQSKVAWFR